jgi:hypothetical protein
MWAIFVGPPHQFRAASTQYVTLDGGVTHRKQEAKKFSTAAAARDFASRMGITVDDVERHVGPESFTPAEADWRPLG